jgi:hypothetical protein
MKKFSYLALASILLPLSVAAQARTTSINSIWDIFTFIKNILDAALPLIIAVAVVYFVYAIFMYVVAVNDEKKAAAKDKIIYGIVGLFIMISVWGLVNILVNTFGLNNKAAPASTTIKSQLPTLN